MLRILLILGLLLAASVACGDDDDSPSDSASATVTGTIGATANETPGPSESDAPTPTTSGEPFQFISLGLRAREVETPPLPSGLFAITNMVEYQADDPSKPATLGLPVTDAGKQGTGLAFWTYEDGAWRKLGVEATGQAAADPGTGQIVIGDFETVPQFLIALVEG